MNTGYNMAILNAGIKQAGFVQNIESLIMKENFLLLFSFMVNWEG